MKKKFFLRALSMSLALGTTACSPFIFGGNELSNDAYESFEGTNNAIFFALYNYYGYDGQHFTNRWLGMNDALAKHGITVTGYEHEKDARKFTVTREADCDLPEDAVIYMVNNQNWDANIQFTRPFATYKPMAVISTCNGVEFAASPILSSGMSISNATMGGFSSTYRTAFEKGSLRYLCAKYSAHILPIFAACVNAVENGHAIKNADGSALSLSIQNWAIQSLEEYDKVSEIDSIDPEHPTLRKLDVDSFFDGTTYKTEAEAASALTSWVSDSSVDVMSEYYTKNADNAYEDKAGYGNKSTSGIKCGIIAPSSVNDSVQSYIDFIRGYLATAYGVTMLANGSVTSSDTQDKVCKQLVDQGADFIISLQDDTNRNAAIEVANENNVYFAIGGSCQNPVDYEAVKNLPYYVGSCGTSIDEDRKAAREMTEYYLQCMIHRAKGDLKEFETEYKLGSSDDEDNAEGGE